MSISHCCLLAAAVILIVSEPCGAQKPAASSESGTYYTYPVTADELDVIGYSQGFFGGYVEMYHSIFAGVIRNSRQKVAAGAKPDNGDVTDCVERLKLSANEQVGKYEQNKPSQTFSKRYEKAIRDGQVDGMVLGRTDALADCERVIADLKEMYSVYPPKETPKTEFEDANTMARRKAKLAAYQRSETMHLSKAQTMRALEMARIDD